MKLTLAKHSFSSTLLILVLSGCTKDKTCSYNANPNLTSSELTWVSCYTNNQTVKFRNELGDSIVTEAQYSTSADAPVHSSSEDPCDVGFQTATNLLRFNNVYSLQIYISVEHYYPDYPQNLNSAGVSFDGNFSTYKFSSCIPQNGIVVNSKTYNGVYVIQIDTTKGARPSIPAVWQAYYTPANGIIQFKTGGGHTWVEQ